MLIWQKDIKINFKQANVHYHILILQTNNFDLKKFYCFCLFVCFGLYGFFLFVFYFPGTQSSCKTRENPETLLDFSISTLTLQSWCHSLAVSTKALGSDENGLIAY